MIESRKKAKYNNLHPIDSDEYVQPSFYDGHGSARNERKLNEKYMNHLEGKWSEEEDIIYGKFIVENQEKLVSKAARRSSKVFKQLAENLKYSRTPEQCRMHHQRMKKKARGRSISAIIKFMNKKYGEVENMGIRKYKKIEKECVEEFEEKKKLENTINPDKGEYDIEYEKVSELNINVRILLDEIEMW